MGEKRADKPRKPGGGRKKLKPEYDAGKNLKEQMDALEKLVRKQRIPQTIRNGAVHSYRYVIAGMLLNHPLCRALGASANND